jgi:hypothetical protein
MYFSDAFGIVPNFLFLHKLSNFGCHLVKLIGFIDMPLSLVLILPIMLLSLVFYKDPHYDPCFLIFLLMIYVDPFIIQTIKGMIARCIVVSVMMIVSFCSRILTAQKWWLDSGMKLNSS